MLRRTYILCRCRHATTRAVLVGPTIRGNVLMASDQHRCGLLVVACPTTYMCGHAARGDNLLSATTDDTLATIVSRYKKSNHTPSLDKVRLESMEDNLVVLAVLKPKKNGTVDKRRLYNLYF